MSLNLNLAGEPGKFAGHAASVILHELDKQRQERKAIYSEVSEKVRTQRKEKVFPLIGYYPDKRVYIWTKQFLKKLANLTAV